MANNINIWEIDQAWLLKLIPDANESEKEFFAEKVAIIVADMGFDEASARKEALEMIRSVRVMSLERRRDGIEINA